MASEGSPKGVLSAWGDSAKTAKTGIGSAFVRYRVRVTGNVTVSRNEH